MKSTTKQELFTDDMLKNMYIFDGGENQPYVRQGERKVKATIDKVYRPITRGGKLLYNRTYGSILRYN